MDSLAPLAPLFGGVPFTWASVLVVIPGVIKGILVVQTVSPYLKKC